MSAELYVSYELFFGLSMVVGDQIAAAPALSSGQPTAETGVDDWRRRDADHAKGGVLALCSGPSGARHDVCLTCTAH